jgi:hypothetical protein
VDTSLLVRSGVFNFHNVLLDNDTIFDVYVDVHWEKNSPYIYQEGVSLFVCFVMVIFGYYIVKEVSKTCNKHDISNV